jgi:hypothetical protein
MPDYSEIYRPVYIQGWLIAAGTNVVPRRIRHVLMYTYAVWLFSKRGGGGSLVFQGGRTKKKVSKNYDIFTGHRTVFRTEDYIYIYFLKK